MSKKSSAESPKKILFVLEHFYPYIGGAEKLFYVLTTALVKRGYEITVITTQFDKELRKEEMHEGVKIIRINCFNRFAFTFLSLPKVIQYGRNCDLIHTTTYNAALPASLAAKIVGKPVFVTFHEVWGDLWKQLPFTSFIQRNAFYYFEKILLKLPFDKFIAVSEFTKSELIKHKIPASKIARIYNGIEYEDFKDYTHSPPEVFTFTYFGRLGISKGLNLLIPAAADFRASFPASKFKLIIPKYPKPLYQIIIELIRKHDLEDYIEFHHNLPREVLRQEILNSSCVVISSYSEGFCFAAAETVALNVPIISSNKGALTEVISGPHISMNEMSVSELSHALRNAYLQKWSEKPIRYFHFKDTIDAYTQLY